MWSVDFASRLVNSKKSGPISFERAMLPQRLKVAPPACKTRRQEGCVTTRKLVSICAISVEPTNPKLSSGRALLVLCARLSIQYWRVQRLFDSIQVTYQVRKEIMILSYQQRWVRRHDLSESTKLCQKQDNKLNEMKWGIELAKFCAEKQDNKWSEFDYRGLWINWKLTVKWPKRPKSSELLYQPSSPWIGFEGFSTMLKYTVINGGIHSETNGTNRALVEFVLSAHDLCNLCVKIV